jgi:ribosomal protein L6P/L9E
MKRVICKSGIEGWQMRLKMVYVGNYAEWVYYAELRGLHLKLGYTTPKEAWLANPMVQGSVDPSDYCKVNA